MRLSSYSVAGGVTPTNGMCSQSERSWQESQGSWQQREGRDKRGGRLPGVEWLDWCETRNYHSSLIGPYMQLESVVCGCIKLKKLKNKKIREVIGDYGREGIGMGVSGRSGSRKGGA